jgi:hypothetical protein
MSFFAACTEPTGNAKFRAILTSESVDALTKAMDRTVDPRGGGPTLRSQIVATLTFDFWSNLFRPDYDRPLWQINLRKVLPLCPTTYTRPDIQGIVRDINHFRNRIAHHEPILNANVSSLYASITGLVGMRCQTTAAWLNHHSTVSAVLRTKPKREGATGPTVLDRCDTKLSNSHWNGHSCNSAGTICFIRPRHNQSRWWWETNGSVDCRRHIAFLSIPRF